MVDDTKNSSKKLMQKLTNYKEDIEKENYKTENILKQININTKTYKHDINTIILTQESERKIRSEDDEDFEEEDISEAEEDSLRIQKRCKFHINNFLNNSEKRSSK